MIITVTSCARKFTVADDEKSSASIGPGIVSDVDIEFDNTTVRNIRSRGRY
jgi:hypothetical protein